MMNDEKDISQWILDAIDEYNEQAAPDQKLERSLQTPLFGEGSSLDSLGLVNFILIAEERIEDGSGVPVKLTDARALSRKNSPFVSVATLAEFVKQRLHEESSAV